MNSPVVVSSSSSRAEQVDRSLRRLVHQEALCRRVLGRLGAALLDRRRHLSLGFVRVADYARERLGMSGRELQELARVARGLEGLPGIAASFQAGELSLSHVRVLVTIATPETETRWLAIARASSVRQLRTAASRSHHEADSPDQVDGEPKVRFHARCPPYVRRQWVTAVELASRMSGTRLPTWRAAEAIAAEALSAVEGSVAADDSAPAPAPVRANASVADGEATATWDAVAAALPDDVRRADQDWGTPFQLDGRLRFVVRALQRIDWQTGRLLTVVRRLRLYRAFGCTSLQQFVEERLGMSVRRAQTLLMVDRAVQRYPALLEAYRSGQLSLARALVLLPVLHPATVSAWTARAREVTIRRLEDLVAFACETSTPGMPVAPPPAEGRLALPPLTNAQMCARAAEAVVTFDGPATVVGLLRAMIHTCTRHGEPAWRGLSRVLEHVIAQWSAQPRARDPIFERDGWRCAVPACSARSSLHDHHVVYRSHGGDNARGNRVAICAAHHLQGIHRFRIKVAGLAPDDLTWEIGWRQSHPPLLRTHGDRYLDASAAA